MLIFISFSLSKVIDLAEPKLDDDGEHVLLQCSGYPSRAGEKLQWSFKEVGVSTAYVIGGTYNSASVELADREVGSIIYDQ